MTVFLLAVGSLLKVALFIAMISRSGYPGQS